MDLRSDRPYWPTTCPRPVLLRAGRRGIRVDMLIVGSGITGALAAYELTKAGARVAVVDSRPLASGSTPASTALLQYEIDTPLVKLTSLLGRAHAIAAYRASRRALTDLKRIDRQLGGGVELIPRCSLQLAVTPADVRALRQEVAARRALGFPVEFLTRRALRARFGLRRPGALLSHEALEVNPLKFTYRLLAAAASRGAIILPHTRLDLACLAAEARPFRIRLPDGGRLTAAGVVLATGYETPEQFTEVAGLTELRSTYALVTHPLPAEPWPGRVLLWESGDPYFYARTTQDGRIMAGGEDEPFTAPAARDALIPAKSRVIMRKLRALLPSATPKPAYRWAGTFAATADGLPYIGRHPRYPGVWFALGYGGNGITFSVIAARIIAGAVTGRPHPAARLFRFDR